MVLHMLHSSRQLDTCLALLSEQDTLLVMDPSVVLAQPGRFEGLPCSVSVLCEPSQAKSHTNSNLMAAKVISHAEWVELACAHPHNMAWS